MSDTTWSLVADTYSIAAVPSDALTTFASNLRRLREEAGLTQEELGARTGIGMSNVSRYESGARDPSVTNLAKLAQGLGVSASRLVEGIP